MKYKAAIFLAKGYEMGEAIIIIDILKRANITVDIVSINEHLQVESSHNVTIVCEKTIKNLNFDNYKILILPGGSLGVKNLAKNQLLAKHLLEFAKSKTKKIAAICAAPQILGKLKILDNKKVTFYPGEEAGLENSIKTSDCVVVSDNIILGKSLGCIFPFTLTIVKELVGELVVETVKEKLVF